MRRAVVFFSQSHSRWITAAASGVYLRHIARGHDDRLLRKVCARRWKAKVAQVAPVAPVGRIGLSLRGRYRTEMIAGDSRVRVPSSRYSGIRSPVLNLILLSRIYSRTLVLDSSG